MGIAAITDDYRLANEIGLRKWIDCFGEGVCARFLILSLAWALG